RTINLNLERLLDFFGAVDCLLVIRRPTLPVTYFTYQASNRKKPRSGPPSDVDESGARVLLGLPEQASAYYNGLATASGATAAMVPGRPSNDELAKLGNLFDTQRFATVPYLQRDGTQGRLFLIPGEDEVDIDFEFLKQLVVAIAQVVENTQLTDELVTKAA